MNQEIIDTFNLYNKHDDYHVKIGDRIIPASHMILKPGEESITSLNNGIGVYSNEFIEKLHPDNIDSREFWKMATDKFPLFSIAGGPNTMNSITEVNLATLKMSNYIGAMNIIFDLYGKNKELVLLEIGPGHGGFKDLIKGIVGDHNYYAIDVNPLFKHPNIYQTDGKTIPDTIPYNLNIVYSINVFQHLSKKQRTSYYKQIYVALKTGGTFIFGMFVITELNKDWPCWGTKGTDGKFYCNFFRQLTEVDIEEELMSELTSYGFIVEKINPFEDKTHYLTFKCVKR